MSEDKQSVWWQTEHYNKGYDLKQYQTELQQASNQVLPDSEEDEKNQSEQIERLTEQYRTMDLHQSGIE